MPIWAWLFLLPAYKKHMNGHQKYGFVCRKSNTDFATVQMKKSETMKWWQPFRLANIAIITTSISTVIITTIDNNNNNTLF